MHDLSENELTALIDACRKCYRRLKPGHSVPLCVKAMLKALEAYEAASAEGH